MIPDKHDIDPELDRSWGGFVKTIPLVPNFLHISKSRKPDIGPIYRLFPYYEMTQTTEIYRL